jgi:uncharacterized protein YqgC (DUF456 family)
MNILLLILLIIALVAGLLLVPLGLPGLWVMVLAIIGYAVLTGPQVISTTTIVVVLALALIGELIEAWAGYGLARRYGSSRRAAWGALVGGIVGAIVGVPVPLVGSVIGGFAGAFAGATLVQYLEAREARAAIGAGWAAVMGRAVAAAAKIGLGVVIAVVGLFAALTK